MNLFYILIPILFPYIIGQVQAETLNHSEHSVEVFTTMDQKVQWVSLVKNNISHQNIVLQVYLLDGIQQIEYVLTKELPTDIKQAKKIALRRLQQLDAKAIAALQQTAIGLTMARQYGLDRYPAIVFDGKAMVFGITDLESALELYRQWLSESQR